MNRQAQLKWTQVRVGLLVLFALAILIVMILNLENGMGLLSGQTRFHAMVNHSQGLKVGGPVRMNGVDVGNVREIKIAPDSPHVEIVFTVQNSAAPHVRQDATVTIRPMGLLGDKYLEVSPGTPSKPPLAEGSLLAGQAEADVTGLATDASVTFEHVNAAIRDLQQLLAAVSQGQGTAGKLITDPELYDRSQRMLEKLEAASEKSLRLLSKVERGEGTIGRLVTDQELYARATQAVKDLTELTGRLNNQNGTLAKLADPAFYSRLDSLAARGEYLLNKLEHGEGTMGKLVNQDDLYLRMDKLLTDVETLVADVKKNPKKYFKFSLF